jgi:hypothetical protein
MRKWIFILLSIIEVLAFGVYASSLSPAQSTCGEARDGDIVALHGFVEDSGGESFSLNDGTGRVVVLGVTFEKGSPVIAEGRVFERGGTKFLDCEEARIAENKGMVVTLRSLAESPEDFLGSVVKVWGRVSRGSSSWFSLESGGFEILVLSPSRPEGEVLVTGGLFYDPLDMRYKIRALEVGMPAA